MSLKFFLTSLSFFFILVVEAQFVNQVLPFKKANFSSIKISGFKKCMKYKVESSDIKTLVAKAIYNSDGTLKTILDNDDIGVINNEEIEFASATEFFFKENGLLNFKEIKYSESDAFKVKYEYKNNVVVKITTLSIDPTIANFKYNTKGKLYQIYTTVRMPVYDDAGEFHGKSIDVPRTKKIVKLNAKGQIIQIDEYNLMNEDAKGKIAYAYFWKYNAQGKTIEYAFKDINNDGAGFIETYKYNNKNLLISSTLFDDRNVGNKLTNYIYEYEK